MAGDSRCGTKAQGRLAEAEPLVREGVTALRKKLPIWPVDCVNGLVELGSILTELDRAKEAEPFLVEALGIARTTGMTAQRSADPSPDRQGGTVARHRSDLPGPLCRG